MDRGKSGLDRQEIINYILRNIKQIKAGGKIQGSEIEAFCDNCVNMGYNPNEIAETAECQFDRHLTDCTANAKASFALLRIPEIFRTFCAHYSPIDSVKGRVVYR